MNTKDLTVEQNQLAEICRHYKVTRLDVFGSFSRGDATSTSDLDVIVTFEDNADIGLELVELKLELERLFGRSVDLITRSSVENSPNKYFRRFALMKTEPLNVSS